MTLREILFGLCGMLVLGFVQCYTDADVKECGALSFGSVTCSSLNYFYRECYVPGAEVIYLIKLHQNLTSENCAFKSTFGYRGKAVWVTNGCSGIFYLCYSYNGSVPVSTPGTSPPKTGDDDVQSASTAVLSNDIYIYIIVGSCVIFLVGICLMVGCVLKRRQQNDSTRHLAEKRQIRIALREHLEDREENGVSVIPIADMSLSVESLNTLDPNDYPESICSSRSSTSGMTMTSSRTTSHLIRGRPSTGSRRSVSHIPSGRLKKGYSTPDIHALGKMYCAMNMQNRGSQRHSNSRSSQRSINSTYSVGGGNRRLNVFDIPIERRLRQQAKRTERFAAGFSGSCADKAYRGSVRSVQGFPTNRNVTRAIVHSPSQSASEEFQREPSSRSRRSLRFSLDHDPTSTTIYEQADIHVSNEKSTNGIINRNAEIQEFNVNTQEQFVGQWQKSELQNDRPLSELHYHDPDSLQIQSRPRAILTEPARPLTPTKPHLETIYSKVARPRIIHPKPKLISNNIYATVNKSMFRATTQLESSGIYEQTPQLTAAAKNGQVHDKTELCIPDESGMTGIDNHAFEIYGSYDVISKLDEIINLEDDEEDVTPTETSERGDMYARMATFKPIKPLSPITIVGLTDSSSNI
ncbi:uncharacterized protein LOC128235738 [Mya arenaria]|uniref:uncharacterized protein LOC128235738 n=1 Tax=Mya arenaria TaxID=6604 RepID=UPI0022E37311|nr:uncharacterized protein LOC128235738 [Mya arenaria]